MISNRTNQAKANKTHSVLRRAYTFSRYVMAFQRRASSTSDMPTRCLLPHFSVEEFSKRRSAEQDGVRWINFHTRAFVVKYYNALSSSALLGAIQEHGRRRTMNGELVNPAKLEAQ
jgi:hypothetical protein